MNKALYLSTAQNCIQDDVKLQEIHLFQEALTVRVPSELSEMPEEERNIYYPYDKQPEVVLSGYNGTVQMTFGKTVNCLQKGQIHEAGKAVADLIRKIEPQRKTGCVHLWDRGNKDIAWFVMELNDGIHRKHIKFITEIAGCFTIGTITYPANEACKWEAVMMYIFASLTENGGRNEKGRI